MKYILTIFLFVFTIGLAVNVYAQPASNCCTIGGNGSPGCDDQTCEDLICGQDPFCCDVTWDGICSAAANNQCDVCLSGDGDGDGDNEDRVTPAPTINQWGMIAVAIALFAVAIFTIRKKVEKTES